MNWSQTLCGAAPGVVAASLSAIALWRSSRHARAAGERDAEEKHHATDATTLVAFNHQLLDERKQLLEGLGVVKAQVVNGHPTNLRDDITLALSMVTDLGAYVRLLRADVSGMTEDVRGLRNDLNALEQRVT